jgi:hypothetical protein
MAEALLKFGQHWNFKNNEHVIIYNLDASGGEWSAIVRGKQSGLIDLYIVEPFMPVNKDYPYSCVLITEACLKSSDSSRRPE